MLDVFDKLSKKSRAWPSRSGGEWATVSLELADVADGPPRYSGIVLIDGRQVGYLIGNRPREFRLWPGEHQIVVHLGREARYAGCPGKAAVSGRISLEPGERVALACRKDALAAEQWGRFSGLSGRYILTMLLGMWLAGGLGWLLFPILGPLILDAVNGLGIGQAVAPVIGNPSRFRMAIAGLSTGTVCLLGSVALSIWERRTIRRLRARVGQAYRIGPQKAGTIDWEDWPER